MIARLRQAAAGYFATAAVAAGRNRDVNATVRYAERALRFDPRLDSMRDLLAGLFLHGENYVQVLARIHEYLRPRTYLEVGVETGLSMRLLRPGTQAIGIDPEPKLTESLPPQVKFFRQTSDEFFAQHDVRAQFGGLPVDLAFIDGMHHFDFALRDFMNLERCCDRDSTIVIDDCFPLDRLTAQRKRVTAFWTGDVWKVIVLLKTYRPDLAIHTIAAPPTGVCIVRKLDPDSRLLAENLQDLCAEFMALDYRYLEKDRAGKLNLVANDWAVIGPLLGSARQL